MNTAMNRRSFVSTFGALFGIGVTCHSGSISEAMSRETYNGPFCVEVYSPYNQRDRSLPMFDNIVQANNHALAQMNALKMDTPAGKILITKPTGAVAECLTWGTGWSQTISYVDCDDMYRLCSSL